MPADSDIELARAFLLGSLLADDEYLLLNPQGAVGEPSVLSHFADEVDFRRG